MTKKTSSANTAGNKDDNSKYILSSLDGAISVLNLFFEHDELSATEIAKLLVINRSSVFRFLATFENRGYLVKDENSRYRLGIKLFSLGQLAQSRMELIRIVHPFLENITNESGETSQLTLLEGLTSVFVDKAVSTSALKMDTPLGSSYFAHHTGGGKAILAFKDEAFIDKYMEEASFAPLTPSSMKSKEELPEVLAKVRKNGVATDAEEAEIGLTCYGVPILDGAGEPIAAISMSGPTTRMKANEKAHIDLLKRAAAEINSKLK